MLGLAGICDGRSRVVIAARARERGDTDAVINESVAVRAASAADGPFTGPVHRVAVAIDLEPARTTSPEHHRPHVQRPGRVNRAGKSS
jgi:hypothetical protein